MAVIEGPKHANAFTKSCTFEIPMDSVLYNTEHCGIDDDTDDEHSV